MPSLPVEAPEGDYRVQVTNHSNRWKIQRVLDKTWYSEKYGWNPSKYKVFTLAGAGTFLATLPRCMEEGIYKLVELK